MILRGQQQEAFCHSVFRCREEGDVYDEGGFSFVLDCRIVQEADKKKDAGKEEKKAFQEKTVDWCVW